MRNPEICFGNAWTIRFVRADGNILVWVQDLFSKKLKTQYINLPLVEFNSEREAEIELKDIVIFYLIKEKRINEKEIVGWL